MIYLSTFLLSDKRVNNPNLYPYNVFRKKEISPFVFAPITVFYGNNGSGKTFTMANVIAALNKPTLIIAHNKTLAGQLYGEFKEFFPENAVEYFVSYFRGTF